MIDIRGINHIGLRVTNLEKARFFYEQLGFVFIIGPVGPEPVAIMEHPSGINFNLILNGCENDKKNALMDVAEKYPGYTHVALEVDDLVHVEKSLRDKNITISEGPVQFPGGSAAIFVRDQDGNVLEFHQPA